MTDLAFVGTTTIDIVQVTDELPAPDRKGWARHAYLDVGGPAANAAITASMLGSTVRLHSAFGDGRLGILVTGLFEPYKVARVGHGDQPDVPVSSIWVAEETGDRTLLSTAASFAGPRPDTVDLGDAVAVLLDGFYADLAIAGAEAAAARKVPIVLDCGSWRDSFSDLLPLASVAIVSEQFELPDRPSAPPAETVADLLDRYPIRLAAVTRGGHSIVWATPTEKGTIRVPKVTAIDTLGAGDVLHGAFMHLAFDKGLDDLSALEGAAGVAARSCEYYGTRAGVEQWAAEA